MLPKHTQEAFKRKQGWEEWQDIIADVNYILLGAQIMQSRYFLWLWQLNHALYLT